MKILFLLIPISLLIVALAIYVFRWALKNQQFDDLSSPAMMPLLDDSEEERELIKKKKGDKVADI